ncbi:MAG TPA: S8 family serine peptidase [Gemmatimonadaceae bacterium]|nr:S8 family serine peptidase [Gemmatimonadaceae bacterium]
MRSRSVSHSIARTTTFGVAVTLTLGCAHGSPPQQPTSVLASAPIMSYAGVVVASLASTGAVVETRTVSLALDRIDQRLLPLDNTYRRAGTGRNVTVYVFDGGVMADHPELAGRVRVGFSGFPNDTKVCNAHGTAVAGAIAGTTLGVAPEAEIVDVKMVECARLRGTIQAIVDGAKWVVEDVKKHPGRRAIANWSFIADTAAQIPALDSAVAMLRAHGVPVVVSAGNLETNACRVSPGNARGAIVVGSSSVMRDASRPGALIDRRSPGTAYGACIDVYAPGDSVLLPSFDRGGNPAAQLWNGTSMSAGYVSGAIALYLEAAPRAGVDEVGEWLKLTATKNVVEQTRAPVSYMLYVGAREGGREVQVSQR